MWNSEYRTFKRWLTTKLHLCCAFDRYAFVFHLSPGNHHDAPEGRKLIETIYSENDHYLLMDRAYEDDKTRTLASENGFIPVVPPKRIVKALGSMIKNSTNTVMRLNAFS